MELPHVSPWGRRLEALALTVCLLVAAVALIRHVAAEPIDHGYTRYGSIAEHMVRAGDYVVPWLGDEIYVLKPPLQSWIIALPIAWLGYLPNWATHLPNLLGAAASSIATWFLARRLLDSARGAALATLILATTTTFVEHSRGERVDPLFADSLVTAIAFFHAAVCDRKGFAGRYVFLAWIALIVALYTKGPFGPLFFLAVAIPYSILMGRKSILISRASLLGCCTAFATFAAWPIMLLHRLGVDRARELFAAAEFAQKVEPWWYYGAAIPKSILPWVVFLPALVMFVRAQRPLRADSPLTLPLLWIVIVVAMLQFGAAKASRYLLPLLAPASILLAAMFQRAEGKARTALRVLGGSTAAALALAAIAAPFLPRSARGIPPEAIPIAVLATAAAIGAIRGFAGRAATDRAPFALALGFLLAFSANDLARVKKLTREDGRERALEILEPVLEREPIRVVDVPANDLGMIESIVRTELPRTVPAAVSGCILVSEGSTTDRELARVAGATRGETFRLDEIDYALWRVPPGPAQ